MSVRAEWPSLTYEQVPWTADDTRTGSRRDQRRHRGPYAAAVVPAIGAATPSLPAAVLATAEDAVTQIARFDAELGAEIAPFAAVLLRTESAASSMIENLTASARAIAEAELRPSSRTNAAVIVANEQAMSAAIRLAATLDDAAILSMHDALLRSSAAEIAGRWRDQQVWIGGSSLGPHAADFVPPHHRRLPAAIADLVSFMDRDDLPVLVHVALAHAQFETIHPFADGNGRVGRALVHAMLRNKGTVRNVTVPISAGLLVDRERYFDGLTRYRAGDPTPIVEAFAEATFAALANGRQLTRELRDVRSDWDDRINVRRGAAAWRVADLLLRQPVVDSRTVAAQLGIAVQNVGRVLEPLERAGVVVEFSGGRRNRLWRAPEVLDVLDGFAARPGRRARA